MEGWPRPRKMGDISLPQWWQFPFSHHSIRPNYYLRSQNLHILFVWPSAAKSHVDAFSGLKCITLTIILNHLSLYSLTKVPSRTNALPPRKHLIAAVYITRAPQKKEPQHGRTWPTCSVFLNSALPCGIACLAKELQVEIVRHAETSNVVIPIE